MQSPVGGRSKTAPPISACAAGDLLAPCEPALGALARPKGAVSRGARIVQLLRHATGVGASLLDLGHAGGPVVHAATEAVRARFAAAWRPPDRAGSVVLADPETGEPMGVAIATPVRLGGQSGFVALIEPDTSTILPRHGALLDLIGELCGAWSDVSPPHAGEGEARLRARNAFLERIGALAAFGTLEGERKGGRIVASGPLSKILKTKKSLLIPRILSITPNRF